MFYGSSEGSSDNMMLSRVMTPTRLVLDGTPPHMVSSEELGENHQQQQLPYIPDVGDSRSQYNTATTEQEPAQLQRINSSLLASSEVVYTLFGENVGTCWGDFSCSHLRIRGRLYITSQAILFYTNMLGFERRICLLLRDVVGVELFRTTSIRIHTIDDERYIFKSFNVREQVLHLINGLKMLADKRADQKNRVRMESSEDTRSGNSSDLNELPSSNLYGLDEDPHLNPTDPQSPSCGAIQESPGIPALRTSPPISPNTVSNVTSMTSNRRRASSDSIIRLPPRGREYNNNLASFFPAQDRLESIQSREQLYSGGGREIEATTSLEDPNKQGLMLQGDRKSSLVTGSSSPELVWADVLQRKKQLEEVGLESVLLPCSMEVYNQTFLAEDAPFSMKYYQKEIVQDKDVNVASWTAGAEGGLNRMISFTHPIKNSIGIGPSSAKTWRHQRLHKIIGKGMTLENRTHVEGIPAADCFYIQDMWTMEVVNEQQLRLSVHFDVIFKKRSFLRSIIQKSVRKETKEWIAGYIDMVHSALREGGHPGEQQSPRNLSDTPSASDSKLHLELLQLATRLERTYQLIVLLVLVLLAAFIFFSYQVMSMHQCVLDIREDLRHLAIQQAMQQDF